ncbi:unnamed protein product [Caenorhabditis angaria]|uniref:7TM GPCR serpentine receptor class x (Srx) domain-containing protein n=1 Tax=Caenorhabditis angaria TaxID=860376 RepID=A0A9P1IYV2_9PELO|nr:unnamed protein product [Caenorhabditis angaria]
MFADVVYKSDHEYIQDSEDIEAGLLVFIPCFIGLIMTLIALRGFYVIPAMNSSFGYLTRYQLYPQIIASLNNNCGYKFYHYGWVFSFIISDTCGPKFEILLRTVQSVMSCIIVILDMGTFISLMFFAKRVLKTKSVEMRKREVNFGRQVVIQGFVAIVYGIFYSFAFRWIPGNVPETWRIFWTSTFIASLLHIVSTGVIFLFNAEFSNWLLAKKKRTMPVSVFNVT